MISDNLDIELVDTQLTKFANGEIFCEIQQSVRGIHVFYLQSTGHPVNDNLLELLITTDALKRASAASITVVMPHYGYSRQNKTTLPRTPITAKLIADLITTAGASRVITMDLHVNQIQGFFNIPFDNIYISPTFISYIKKVLRPKNPICIAPYSGGVERVRHYAKKLNCDLGIIDKRRTGQNIAKIMNIIGDVKGKECIIIDDMIDTAGTPMIACEKLKELGATKVYFFATHPILSGPAIERINNSKFLDQLIVTDTLTLSKEAAQINKLKVLSAAPLLSKAIFRTFKNESLSSLFL